MKRNKSRNPSKPAGKSIRSRIKQGEYIMHTVYRPTALALETDAAENQSFGVIYDLHDALGEEAADGREEFANLKATSYSDMTSAGIFGARFWLHESEPGATLTESDALDAVEEDAIEGATGVEQYEAIPISPFILAKHDGNGAFYLRFKWNPLKVYKAWKKRALQIDSDTSKSNLNLCVLIKCDQNQSVNCHTYVDRIFAQYQGANRLGLKSPITKL